VPCSVRAQVTPEGLVSLVHTASTGLAAPSHLALDSNEHVRVGWAGGLYPTAENGCAAVGGVCSVRGDTCVCDTTVTTEAVFTNSSKMPTRAEVLAKLHIGSPPPDVFDSGTYAKCTSAPCFAASEVEAFHAASGAFDERTVFKVVVHGEAVYLANLKSTVAIGAFEFRNPPSIMNPLVPTLKDGGGGLRDAELEVEALLDHLVHHPNTAPFLARQLIQRFVTSNPSPRYVEAVAAAFTEGKHGGKSYSGRYADLGAAVAAVLLDAEARSPVLDLDPTHGQYREPLLKVIHFMRALELRTEENMEVDLENLDSRIGMEPYNSQTVFNFFLPDFTPDGPLEVTARYGPETHLLNTPYLLGFLNGVSALVNLGLSSCSGGFGTQARSNKRCGTDSARKDGLLTWAPLSAEPSAIVDELGLLLTAGRLNPATKDVIVRAYEEALGAAGTAGALKVAQELFAASAEFHVSATNGLTPTSRPPRADVGNGEVGDRGYKAIVVLFMFGGCDSYNVLVPHSQCRDAEGSAFDLFAEYTAVRTNLALPKEDLTPISVANGAQPCDTFGVHGSLGVVSELFEAGEAAFVANVGPLVEPVTKAQYLAKPRTVELPPSLFAHNQQQRHTQTVVSDDMNADGVLGRILNSLIGQPNPYRVGAYSVTGNARVLKGLVPPDIIDAEQGIVRLSAYNRLAGYIHNMTKLESSSAFAETYSRALSEMLSRTEVLGELLEDVTLQTPFASSGISRQFEQVAKLIKTRSTVQTEREVFFVSRGGFDNHNELYLAMQNSLGEINEALASFVAEMGPEGQNLWDSVTIVSASDFARTLTSNGAGSDHAWGGNHWVLGGSVKADSRTGHGQMFGAYPSRLSIEGDQILDRGRVIPTTSWEAVWDPIAQWFGVAPADLDTVLPNRANFLPGGLIEVSELFEGMSTSEGHPKLFEGMSSKAASASSATSDGGGGEEGEEGGGGAAMLFVLLLLLLSSLALGAAVLGVKAIAAHRRKSKMAHVTLPASGLVHTVARGLSQRSARSGCGSSREERLALSQRGERTSDELEAADGAAAPPRFERSASKLSSIVKSLERMDSKVLVQLKEAAQEGNGEETVQLKEASEEGSD